MPGDLGQTLFFPSPGRAGRSHLGNGLVEEILSTLAFLRGVQGIAHDLWVGLDLPDAVTVSVDEVPGVAIVLDELVQLQAQLLDIGVHQPGANTGLTWHPSQRYLILAGCTIGAVSRKTSFFMCLGNSD